MRIIKIGVLSDTHDKLDNITKIVQQFLADKVEKVVHCGDYCSPFVVRALKELKGKNVECIGVYGNNDGERDGLLKVVGDVLTIKGDFCEVEWDGLKIGIYHGTNNKLLENIIDSNHYNLVLCGHTHQIRVEERHDVVIVNPGESCGYLTEKASYAIIDLSKKPFTKDAVRIEFLK